MGKDKGAKDQWLHRIVTQAQPYLPISDLGGAAGQKTIGLVAGAALKMAFGTGEWQKPPVFGIPPFFLTFLRHPHVVV